jgi:hypothetical protein
MLAAVKPALRRIRGLTSGVNASLDFPGERVGFLAASPLLIRLVARKTRKEDSQMSVNTKAPTILQVEHFGELRQVSEAMQFVQYFLFDEIPGLVFGLMTVAYIVTSLWSLT